MKKMSKRIIAGFMALVMVFGVVLSGQMTVQAKGRKQYKAWIYYENKTWSCKQQNGQAHVSIKNKKGKARYTITLHRSQCIGENIATEAQKGPVKNTQEISVCIGKILKDHKAKDIKITNVVVKCDGKKVKLDKKKIRQFVEENEGGEKSYCLSVFNQLNKANRSAKPAAFTWKETLSVSFQINIKK